MPNTAPPRRTKRPALDLNHLATLIALLAMLMVAAVAGYRLQISLGGVTFAPGETKDAETLGGPVGRLP